MTLLREPPSHRAVPPHGRPPTRRLPIRRRVPVVLQMATADCAPACLSMILRYFGSRVPLSRSRQECHDARDGSSAQDLIVAARALGMPARGLTGPPDALTSLRTPFVVHWQSNHFVVVERIDRDTVSLVDPAVGRRRVTWTAFVAAYSGVVVTFERPVAPPPTTPRRRSPLVSLVIAALRPLRWKLAHVLLASLAIQVLALSVPVATGLLLDDIVPRGATAAMPLIGIGLLSLVLAQFLVEYLRGSWLVDVGRRVDSALMHHLFRHILALPLRFFENHRTADLVERLGSTTLVRELVTGQVVATVLDSVFLVVYLVLLLVADPVTAVVAVVLAAAQVAIVASVGPHVRVLLHEHLLAQALSQSCLLESLQSIATVKASGAGRRIFGHWSRLFEADLDIVQRRARVNAQVQSLQTAVRLLSTLFLLWLGAWRVMDGQLQLGEMLALIALATLLLEPVNSLVVTVQQLQSAGAHLARIGDVLDAEPEPVRRATVHVTELQGRLELRGVSFRYHPGAPLVLDDVSVAVDPGQKLAIVGASGSGKSTLGMLLLGLYEPTAGRVLVDGHPAESLDRTWLRDRFGVVLQHGGLFSESVAHNVSLADPDMSTAEIVDAARTAHIHEDIARLPLGYTTMLVEAGGGLSGGQRQRLAIARAIARRPRVLLLDEATSSLDTVTEAQVESSLRNLACTRVVIAHRLSTVSDADRLVVLDGGRVVESGSPGQLLQQRGAYWSLARGPADHPSTP